MPEEKIDENDEKEELCKRLSLTSEMDINVVHKYSYLVEKLLRIKYNALCVNLKLTLQFCGGCARSKAKSFAVSKMLT